MSITQGVRTWKRISRNPSLPLDERVQETTHYGNIEQSMAEADFLTIPRAVYADGGVVVTKGYSIAYAEQLAKVLARQFGFRGALRLSRSGNSFVFEREPAPTGVAYDFGLAEPVAPQPAQMGNGLVTA